MVPSFGAPPNHMDKLIFGELDIFYSQLDFIRLATRLLRHGTQAKLTHYRP